MARIFISYASAQRPLALEMQRWLAANGWEDDVFVDVDPNRGIGGGAFSMALRFGGIGASTGVIKISTYLHNRMRRRSLPIAC